MARVLEKALDVLALFGGRAEWAESEVARELELPTSTAHRILRTLEGRGYLARTGGGRYRLGPAAAALGRGADGTDALRPALARLAAETGETAVLGVAGGGGLLVVDRIESAAPLRLSLEVGAVVPLHAGATSRALLAHLPPADVERVLAGPLPRLAPGTITDPVALRAELERVRARGYATSREETNAGAWGVAAPVLGPGGQARAVLAVVAPLARHSRRAERDAVAAVTRATC